MVKYQRGKTALLERMQQAGVVNDALHGDIRPLIALLRSDAPLAPATREYMARELENAPKQRFLRRRKENPATVKRDHLVLGYLDSAKLAISDESDGTIQPWSVSDASAIDRLARWGGDWVNEAAVNNARRRAKARGRSIIEYANGKGQVKAEK